MITNGSAAAVPVQSSGKSNSGSLFRYDEESGQYVYNLKTKGFAAGTYGVTGVIETGVNHSVGFSLR